MTINLKRPVGMGCILYFDKLLISWCHIEEHDFNLAAVCARLKECGIVINERKSKNQTKKIRFLGFQILENNINPIHGRSQEIIGYKAPRGKKKLQRFLGIIKYDICYIKDLSTICKPLYELLKDKKNSILGGERILALKQSMFNGK